MRDGIEAFLRSSACFEVADEFLAHYGRLSPYIFRTPTPFTAEQLQVIGENGARLIRERANGLPVHVIGVATRGIPLATAITIELRTEVAADASLSIVGRDGSTDHLAPDLPAFTVVIDNALVSGRTMELVLGRVQRLGLHIDLVMYLFDREEVDSRGIESPARVASQFGCEVLSIFSLRDVIDVLREESGFAADRIVRYARMFGSKSLQDFIASSDK